MDRSLLTRRVPWQSSGAPELGQPHPAGPPPCDDAQHPRHDSVQGLPGRPHPRQRRRRQARHRHGRPPRPRQVVHHEEGPALSVMGSSITRVSSTWATGGRLAAGGSWSAPRPPGTPPNAPLQAASILLNGVPTQAVEEPTTLDLNSPTQADDDGLRSPGAQIEQSAEFFNPANKQASELREKVAMGTLEELLDYLLVQNGSVGILDATNSTIYRRQIIVQRIREREPKLGILFIESICHDQDVGHSPLCRQKTGPG